MTTARLHLLSLALAVLIASSAFCQRATPDGHAREMNDLPAWTSIKHVSLNQEGRLLSLVLEVADSIPRGISDSCLFQFLLNTGPGKSNTLMLADFVVDHAIVFDLTHWDGSPWFAVTLCSRFGNDGIPADTTRMFDWKLARNTLRARFSLDGLGWNSVSVRARIFYKTGFSRPAPDSGAAMLSIDPSGLQAMRSRSSNRTRIIYPEGFDTLITKYDVLHFTDIAYDCERQLTGVAPVGGDTVRLVFNGFYGGAAIEGDPIYLGPSMWGNRPLWFVYFHEMGHNFANASARFRQMYPLETKLTPGPLPTHILFYEAWASLPAMYVFDMIDRKGIAGAARDAGLDDLRNEWRTTKGRFEKAWTAYKDNPSYSSLNPDVVDGMFIELQKRFGWELYQRFFAIMRPPSAPLALFNTRLKDDTWDLRATRVTFTVAALSAAANTDLRSDFKKWGFPVDDALFLVALKDLQQFTQ